MTQNHSVICNGWTPLGCHLDTWIPGNHTSGRSRTPQVSEGNLQVLHQTILIPSFLEILQSFDWDTSFFFSGSWPYASAHLPVVGHEACEVKLFCPIANACCGSHVLWGPSAWGDRSNPIHVPLTSTWLGDGSFCTVTGSDASIVFMSESNSALDSFIDT